MTEPKRYRLVTDYGHGDKTWVHRDLTLDQAIQAYMSSVNWQDRNDPPSLDQAMDNEYQVHYLEEDHPGDQEDWDWQDSWPREPGRSPGRIRTPNLTQNKKHDKEA